MAVHKISLIVWIYTSALLGNVFGQVNLTPGTVVVEENNPVTLTCTYTGTGPVILFVWYEVVGDVGGTDDINKGSIFSSGCTNYLVDATKYTYSCPSNKHVTWTIKNVDKSNNEDRWACSVTVSSIIYSNAVSIGVTVPIQNVTMIQPTSDATLDVVENTEQRFICRTDNGLPVADITWYKDNGTPGDTSDDIKIQQNITPTHTTDNGLYIRTSTLKLYTTRSDGNNRVYCSAKNIQGQTFLISAQKPLLNVLYPPSIPTIYYNTISDSPISVDLFDVVAGDSLPLACSADGQPEPNFTWLFDNKQLTGQSVVLSSIDKDMVDTSIKCIAKNQLKETVTTVTMYIMYPPDKPTIRLKYGSDTYTSISDTFSVIEGTAFVLDCQGTGKPDPSYHWLGSGIQSSSEFHIPVDTTSRDSYNVYTCEVTNLMNRTYGLPSNQEGTNSSNVTANVLYGPVVLSMSNQSAEEGEPFRYNCPYTPGNPAGTTVKWISEDGSTTMNSKLLDIRNVSKNDKMKYICTVENIMMPSNQYPVTAPASGYFYLVVKYKASIEEFVVEGHTGKEVTVDEFTSPTLVCNVDSNPASNIQVLFPIQTLAEASNTLQLIYQLSNVSCGNIGIYTCAGRNYLNTQSPSTREIVLLVNCRPQPYGDIDNTVYTAQRTAAFLRMGVLAYPVTANVIWQKDETDLKNSEKLTMTSTFVKTNGIHIDIIQLHLIIYDVSVPDFGQYKVQIRNDVGMMEKIFYLKEQEPVESEQPKQNIGTIVGAFAGGAVFAGLVSIVVVAVVFLLRRHKATEERESDNQQPIGLDQAGATKTTDDTSNHSNKRLEEPIALANKDQPDQPGPSGMVQRKKKSIFPRMSSTPAALHRIQQLKDQTLDSSTEKSSISGVEPLSSSKSRTSTSDSPKLHSPDKKKLAPGISSSFVDPLDLSIDIYEDSGSEEEYDYDVEDKDYEPSFDIYIGPTNDDISEASFAEDFFPVPHDGEDDEDDEIEIEGVYRVQTSDDAANLSEDQMFVCSRESLLTLSRMTIPGKCKECCNPLSFQQKTIGSAIYLKWICEDGGKDHDHYSWCSQPVLRRGVHSGDLMISAAILYSGNNFQKISLFANFLNLAMVSSSAYHRFQTNYLVPTVERYWDTHVERILMSKRGRSIVILGDGRMDSPGHCAQYCTYTAMDNATKEILSVVTVDKRETGKSSIRMEKEAFVRTLEHLETVDINVSEVVTDAHTSIAAHLRKECPQIQHSYDIWHVAKNLGKKIMKAAQQKQCGDLKGWCRHIVNHFYHTCDKANDVEEFTGIWFGLLHHVVNEHEWDFGSGNNITSCVHGPLIEPREIRWLDKGSAAHDALRMVVADRRFLNQIPYFLNARSTAELEGFNNLILMYAGKRFSYIPPVYRARNLLAAIDHNSHLFRPQVINKDGNERVHKVFNKKSSRWLIRPVKETKSYEYRQHLMEMVLRLRMEEKTSLFHPVSIKADDPRRISATISQVAPPSTDQLRLDQLSRF